MKVFKCKVAPVFMGEKYSVFYMAAPDLESALQDLKAHYRKNGPALILRVLGTEELVSNLIVGESARKQFTSEAK